MGAPWDAFGDLGPWTIPADVGNVLLGGIPADIRTIFVRDVDWEPLMRAASGLTAMAATVDRMRARFDNSFINLSVGWSGPGFDAYARDVWLPRRANFLSMASGLREAAGNVAQMAAQACQMHMIKVQSAIQAIQNQLWIMGIGFILGSPQVSAQICSWVAGEVSGLGMETLAGVIGGLTGAGSNFITRAIAGWLASTPITTPLSLGNGLTLTPAGHP